MPAFIGLAGLGIGLAAVILIAILLLSIFWIVEIVDVLRREFRDPIMKIVWLLVIFFTHFVGAVLYYFLGKPQGKIPGQAPRY